MEEFEVHVHLGHVRWRAEVLAMVSSEAWDALEVDQFQDFDCFLDLSDLSDLN